MKITILDKAPEEEDEIIIKCENLDDDTFLEIKGNPIINPEDLEIIEEFYILNQLMIKSLHILRTMCLKQSSNYISWKKISCHRIFCG